MDTATNKYNTMIHSSFLSLKRTTPSVFDFAATAPPIPNLAEGAEARRGLPDEVNSYRPTYEFVVVDKNTNKIVRNLGDFEPDYLKNHLIPMFCRIDYTTQGKEATPAVTKQLKGDKFILDEYNIEDESARNRVHTPVYHEGKYPGKSKYPAQTGQADTDLSSELD